MYQVLEKSSSFSMWILLMLQRQNITWKAIFLLGRELTVVFTEENRKKPT
ncbi:unnamed protein product [Brassica oleracea var. botrytis]